MFKRIAFFACSATALLMGGCTSFTSTDYTVKGKIEGLSDSTTVYLSSSNKIAEDKFDSAYVVGGKFQIKAPIHEREVVFFNIKGKYKAYPVFIQEGNTISIQGEVKDISKLDFEGNEVQDLYSAFEAEQEKLDYVEDLLYDEFSAARKAGDEVKMDSLLKVRKEITQERDALVLTTIQKQKDNAIGPFLLFRNARKYDLKKLEGLFNMLGGNAQQSFYYNHLKEVIHHLQQVQIGHTAPDFSLNDIHGKPFHLSDYKGGPIILDFWSSGCMPCRRENPNMAAIYKDYKDKGLHIVGISLDTKKDQWMKAIEEDGITWTQVSSLDSDYRPAADVYGVMVMPHIVLIDKDFKIVAKNLRGKALRNAVAKLFDQ